VWQQAAAVAQVEGIHATARATRLNFERLKANVTASAPSRAQAEVVEVLNAGSRRPIRSDSAALARGKKQPLVKPGAAQFVSMQMTSMAPRHAMTIELTSRNGERMRIESADAIDLATVVQSFWSRRP
jgi:enhancing lycopene biosynthesis protein 2